MKLIVRRDQKDHKGIFGGHKGMLFNLSCRVQLTPEEQQLISKYKVEEYPLTYRTVGDTQIPGLKIGDLVHGVGYEVKDVTSLLSTEETIKGACESFKSLLVVMASFGGDEVFEF
jgi:hypothetical protein